MKAIFITALLASACSSQSPKANASPDTNALDAKALGLMPNANVQIAVDRGKKGQDLPNRIPTDYLRTIENSINEGVVGQFRLQKSDRWKIETKSRQMNFGNRPAIFTESKYRGILQFVEVDAIRSGEVIGIACKAGAADSYLVYETSTCRAAVEKALGLPTPMSGING
ncbi:hypothetical protein [Sphingomonas bacterium]|uniref:hypothetical protein n=1 Tax=Sphingomonas bacterium TaxID=1895847 RepID=UPI0026189BEB|nr:hypothetical protein [Sphingomonas bacterium]